MACPAPPALRGTMREQEPMARHTTWRVGGPAQRFYEPADRDDLAALLRSLPPDEPLFWLGLGSNLLVRDGGIRGTVIHTTGRLSALERLEGDRIRVEAGVPCPRVARFCAQERLTGAEFLAGIPGTMGGALQMNAGAFGGETWALVAGVETVDRQGVQRRRDPAEYRIGYRSVQGPPGEWFCAATLQLESGDPRAARQRVRDLLERRGATQPTGLPSAGSVFRNPPGDHAARLIEAAGLKGASIGGARVSTKHANFIINSGGASAADIEALIERVEAVVLEKHGVELQREVHIVGERLP
ncbi:MAG TPA: UDP-N-acetylmuramate dehydrogenase [Gammaproteobacteria bacterium]|nr:UDP-N-acetylmuramate dehydrogenase [Gammaproteobacteria bacterium]